MTSTETSQEKYEGLDRRRDSRPTNVIDPHCLLTFDYEYSGRDVEVVIDTPEFTACCPWTGLPDFGRLTVTYVPSRTCIELKSFKYYLLSYSAVGIVQEHAANRILEDLVTVCQPNRMSVRLDYRPRGGIKSSVTATHPGP